MCEWNAIDLHMHTVVGITGDGKEDEIKNFSYVNYINVIKTFDLKLSAITNHNYIDIKNFILCRYLSRKLGSNVLFGVELDTDRADGKNYHLLMIFNEPITKCIEISKNINESTRNKKSQNKVRYTSEEIITFIQNYDVVIIPHGDKDRGLLQRPTRKEIDDALKKVREGFIRVFDSPSNWKLAEIKKFIDDEKIYDNIDEFGGVLFSDNRDWLNYSEKFRQFYMNAEPTFKGFIHSITNPVDRFSIKDNISYNSNYIKRIEITSNNNNSRINDCSIELKSGYNCIIGKSGSGKSLLLHIIKKFLANESGNGNYYFINNNDIKIYNENNELLQKNSINIGIGESIFLRIINSSNSKNAEDMYEVIELLQPKFKPKKKFNEFVENYKKMVFEYVTNKKEFEDLQNSLKLQIVAFKSDNAELDKLNDIQMFGLSIPEKEKFEYNDKELEKLRNFSNIYNELYEIINTLKTSEKDDITNELKKVKILFEKSLSTLYKKMALLKYKNFKIEIISKILGGINSSISKNAKRKQELLESRVSNIKQLVSNFKKYYLLKKELESYDLSIDIDKINSKEELFKEEKINVSENIDINEVKKLNIKNNNIFYTRGIQQQLCSNEYDMSSKEEAKTVIDKYYKLDKLTEQNISKIFSEIKLQVNVYFNGQNVKELNPGSISKTYIELYFKTQLANDNNTVILYDQIENDVDKEFIATTIVKSIRDAKKKAQVIIVTHDPIVAVNADPINYIEATKDSDNKITYRNFVPESSSFDELKTIAKNVDGSITVIKERYEIYRGEKNYEN